MTAQPNNILAFHADPAVSVVAVTPETAGRWLERNAKNRKLSERDIAKYARDMAAGNWTITGESVKFDQDGKLLDGQHRLRAVIRSGVTVRLIVMRGIPTDAQKVMDTGRARTASDALSMGGASNTTMLAATAKLALGVQAGATDPGKFDVSHAEIETFVNEHPSLATAVEFARQVSRRTDCPASVVAYTWFVLSRIDADDATDFWMSAADKVGLRDGDPVIALTNRFAEGRRNRERLSKRIYLSLIYRAWNARRAGKTMRFIRVNSPSGGLVPIHDPV